MCVKVGLFPVTRQILPQLEHRGNEIPKCFDVLSVWQGTAMSGLEHQYRAWTTIEEADRGATRIMVGNDLALRYSSPWPWVFALAVSTTMWSVISWLIWKLV